MGLVPKLVPPISCSSGPLDGIWNSTHPQDEDPGIRYWAIEAGAFAQHFFGRCGTDRLTMYTPAGTL